MSRPTPKKQTDHDLLLAGALSAHQNRDFSSIRRAADAFGVSASTLRDRVNGRTSRRNSHQMQQTLSEAEETTSLRCLTRLTRSGFPTSPRLVMEMAEQLRNGRVLLSTPRTIQPRPIGYSWLDPFKSRHPGLSSVWTRQIEGARFRAANYDDIRRWFDAITELLVEHQYPVDRIYSMDESGFAAADSQSSRALVNIRESASWKVITGRQECSRTR